MSVMHKSGYMPWDRSGNRILLQSDVGKSKPSTYNLPEEVFSYGKKIYQDPQKANQLMYEWKLHQNSQNKNNNKFKDLVQTNKQCLKKLIHTSNGFSNYRKTNTLFKTMKEGSKMLKIDLPQQNFAYGKPLDLQDPIKLVIANNYGQTDKIARHTFYMSQEQAKSQIKRKLSCHITKNHHLVKQATSKRLQKFDWGKKAHSSSLWKMSKYQKIAPRTCTNRRASSVLTKSRQIHN